LYRRLDRAIRYRLVMARQDLSQRTQQGAFARMMDGINRRQQRLDESSFRLERAERQLMERCHRRWEIASAMVRHYDARQRLAAIRLRLNADTSSLATAAHARLLAGRALLERRIAALEALSPVAILNRGYALVFDANGQLVKDAERLKSGEGISVRLAHGRIRARVNSVEAATETDGAALE
jgi:exodeoxyribonuclease VII large subunit